MTFLHKNKFLSKGDIVEVDCSHQCNVMLTDDVNFRGYKSGGPFSYYGGFFKILPARLVVPHTGFWNITIDLGGGTATIRYNLRIVNSPTGAIPC